MKEKKFKIVTTRSFLPIDLEYMQRGLKDLVGDRFSIIVPTTYDEDEICKTAIDADVLLGPYVTKRILETAKQLKLIQVPWTGMDTFDFSAVEGKRVPVCNTHSNADAVAELGVALVLDLIKKVSYHDRKMRMGNWNREQYPLSLNSKLLSKQTVCILGCGKIGYKIAKLLNAFGATIFAVDSHVKEDVVIQKAYANDDIQKAVIQSDIVISTLPLTNSTRNIISAKFLDVLKDGTLLVNLSRAAIVDEDALYEALCSGKVGGFASDVWWNAPKRGASESFPSSKNEFWKLDNVVMSPHRAGFVEGCLPHLDEAITNIANLIQGEALINIVDVENHF